MTTTKTLAAAVAIGAALLVGAATPGMADPPYG